MGKRIIGGSDLCVLVGAGIYADQGLSVREIQVYRAVDDYVPGSDSDIKKLKKSMPHNSYGARIGIPYGFVESVSVDGKTEWENVDVFPEAGRNSFHGRGDVVINFVDTRESDEVANAVLATNVGLRRMRHKMAEQSVSEKAENYLGEVRSHSLKAREYADDNEFAMADAHLGSAKDFLDGMSGMVMPTNSSRKRAENIYFAYRDYVNEASGGGE